MLNQLTTFVKGTLWHRLTYSFSSFNTKFNMSHFYLKSINSLFSPLMG